MENHATPAPKEKPCSICGMDKPLDQFENDRRRPDGHGPRCKECIKLKRKRNFSTGAAAEFARAIKDPKRKAKLFPKEKKSRLQGTRPGFDKFGVDMRESAMCTCSKLGEPHYGHRHVEIINPDGPGNIRVCWVKGCDCKKFVSKTGGKN